MRLANIRLSTSGALAPAPRLLLANHVSWLDIFALGGAVGVAFVAHDGLAAHPLLRWLCSLNDTIFVGREARGRVGTQVSEIGGALGRGETLALFPEGTTGDGKALLPFKSSLLAAAEQIGAAVSVHPVWIDYGAEAQAIAWFGDESGPANALRVLAQKRSLEITVHMLEPIGSAERTSRKTMAAAARRAIEKAAGASSVQRVAL